ncbi:unnamed protein product [Mytilus coruscus]|uniref:Uncharacterized protein n=1 Tax=Mytilus coruscus TaxID=42192 RepID=A0A6J8ETJ4_MYTCO|nr:unnamed protein product [Mytilus coruscus]
MSQYIFTNYSVTEDITTEDEGFNSREEDSIYSSPRTPRTEEDRETASIVSTDAFEESTTETVQSRSDIISNSSSDSFDSFSSIESQIEQFFQYQRENREKFGGILEQQISRLRRQQFDPEFPQRKSFTEDSTQTTYVENKSLSSICTYVKTLRTLISEKIQGDNRTDLEENLQHWYQTLSEHAEDIALTEEDKERLIKGAQDELSEIIQNIIDKYNVQVISSGENMWSADKISSRGLTPAARKYDSSNLKESDMKSNTQKDNSQFSQYLKKYETPETSKQGKFLSNDRNRKATAQSTYEKPQMQVSSKQPSYPEADRYDKRYNPIPSSSAYEQYESKTSRQRKLSEYGRDPYSDPLERISQKYDLIKSKPRDDLLTRQNEKPARNYDSSNLKEMDIKSNTQKDNSQFLQYMRKYDTPETSKQGKSLINDRNRKATAQFTYEKPQMQISSKQPSYPETDRYNKQSNPVSSSSAYEQYDSTTTRQRKLSEYGEYPYSDPLERISQKYDLIKSRPRDDQRTRQDEEPGYKPSERMFQKYSMKDRKPVDDSTSQKYSSMTKPPEIDRCKDSYHITSLMPANKQIRESSVMGSREQPIDTFPRKETTHSPIFKEDKLTTSQEKPKQNIVCYEPTEEEIVQNILDAALKKELKRDRLPEDQKVKKQRSDMLPKGQRKLSDYEEYPYSDPLDKISHKYDLIKSKPRDDQFSCQDEKLGYEPSERMFQKNSMNTDRKLVDYPTSQKYSSTTKPPKIDRYKDSYHMKSLMPANKQIRERSVMGSREQPIDTFSRKETNRSPIFQEDKLTTSQEKPKQTIVYHVPTEEEIVQNILDAALKKETKLDRLPQEQKIKQQRSDMLPKGQTRDIVLTYPPYDVRRAEPVNKRKTDDRQSQKVNFYPNKTEDIYKQKDTTVQPQNPELKSHLYEDQYRPVNTSATTKQTNYPTGVNYKPGASRSTMDERYRNKDNDVTEEERYKPIVSRSTVEEAYKLADDIVTREEKYKPTASQRKAEERHQPMDRNNGPIKELTEEERIQGTVNVPLKSEAKRDRLLQRQEDLEQESSVIPNEQVSIRHTYPPYDVIHQKPVHKMASEDKQKQTVDNRPGTVVDGFQQIDSLVTNEHSIKPTENKRTVDKIYKQTDTPVTMKQKQIPVDFVANDDMYTSTDRPVTSKQEWISKVGSSMSDEIHKPGDSPFKKEHIPKPIVTSSLTIDRYKPVNRHITTDAKSVFVSKGQGPVKPDTTETKYKLTDGPPTNEQKTEAMNSRFTNEKRFEQKDKSADIRISDGEKYRIFKEEQRYEPVASKSTLDEMYTQKDSHVLEKQLNMPLVSRRAVEERFKQMKDTPVIKDKKGKQKIKENISDIKYQPTTREVTEAQRNIETTGPKIIEEQYKPTESRTTDKEKNKPKETHLINEQSQSPKKLTEKYKPKDVPAFTEQRYKPTDNRNIFDNRYTPREIHSVKDPRSTPEDILSTDDEWYKSAYNLSKVKEQNKYKPTESTVTNKQVTVRKPIIPEDLRYHENTVTIKDERLESYSPSTDNTEKCIDRQQSIFDLPNPDDGVQVSLKPTKSWCQDGDSIFLLKTPDSEQDSDEDLSFNELEKTIYSKKASPRRKSIADELKQYFTDHPESPMLSTTLLSLPKTPGMQRPQYLNTLKGEQAFDDLSADNETGRKRITKDDYYFESTCHEKKVR